jgi:hypothetical protein
MEGYSAIAGKAGANGTLAGIQLKIGAEPLCLELQG